jgi:hypothetical protein
MTEAPDRGDGIASTGRVTQGLTILAVLVAFCVSPMTLTAIGVNYEGDAGNPLLKVHPANWIFAIALLSNWLSKRDPIGYLSDLPRVFPGVLLFVLMGGFTLAFATVVQHVPATPLVDTFFAGTAMLVLYVDLDQSTLARLRILIHVILFTNACVGLGEYLTQTRLTPFVVAGVPVLHDYRSTALLGHPLLNAGTSAGYVLMLFFGGHPWRRPFLKATLIAVQSVAMVAFGGRAAIVLMGLFLAIGSLPTIAGVVNGRRFDQRAGLAAVLGLPAILAASITATASGFLTNFVDRFVDDKGSAQARVVIFDLFDNFSIEEILLGPDQQRLASLQTTFGIGYGIENSWLDFLFRYGAVATVFLVLGIFALLAEIMRRTRRNSIFLVVYFLILVGSSASISVKSFAFNHFAILLLVVFGRGGEPSHAVRFGRAGAQPMRT